jgi:ppGpp synthetase/RelA/SpoT-type nucleotidyltranferase
MRQQRWVELIKDYDVTINYASRKANIVENALSRKEAFNMLIERVTKRITKGTQPNPSRIMDGNST